MKEVKSVRIHEYEIYVWNAVGVRHVLIINEKIVVLNLIMLFVIFVILQHQKAISAMSHHGLVRQQFVFVVPGDPYVI